VPYSIHARYDATLISKVIGSLCAGAFDLTTPSMHASNKRVLVVKRSHRVRFGVPRSSMYRGMSLRNNQTSPHAPSMAHAWLLQGNSHRRPMELRAAQSASELNRPLVAQAAIIRRRRSAVRSQRRLTLDTTSFQYTLHQVLPALIINWPAFKRYGTQSRMPVFNHRSGRS
jgi:hypothetical protein